MFEQILRFLSSDAALTAIGVLTSVAAGVFFAQISASFLVRRGIGRSVPVSFKIAVVGLPAAGKTTLITALFELIQRGVHVGSVRIHGMNTIALVNRNISLLSAGEAIGPTTEKDVFVFRFSYVRESLLFRSEFDIEIADFPGEYSNKISSGDDGSTNAERVRTRNPSAFVSFDQTLFDQEFFSWIASSRRYVFLIDLSSIYSSENVRKAISEVTARIRTSWQVVEDAASERGIGDPRKRSVHVVFSKLDTLRAAWDAKIRLPMFLNAEDLASSDYSIEAIKRAVQAAGEGKDLSKQSVVDPAFLRQIEEDNEENFRDLFDFFEARIEFVSALYSSMTLLETDGTRLGMRQLLEAILPSGNTGRSRNAAVSRLMRDTLRAAARDRKEARQ